MRPWRSWAERRREIQQELAFAAAGISDLVNIDSNAEDDDVPRCPECGAAWPDDKLRCEGCGYPEPINVDG